MNQLTSLRVFAKVAEVLSFAEAAKHLGVSNSVVTRSITMLEEHLKVRLISRTTRRVALTTAGKLYREGCIELLEKLDHMDQSISLITNKRGGSLNIAASTSYATTDLPDVLAEFNLSNPYTNFSLTLVDNLSDVGTLDFDVFFSAERRLRDSSLISRPLTRTSDVIVASPSYLQRHRAPQTPHELAGHRVLLASDSPSRYWEFLDAMGTHRVVVEPLMNVQNPLVVKRAVKAGLGIARLCRTFVETELADQTLVPILSNARLNGNERTVWILYSGQPHMESHVRNFIDFVVARYRSNQDLADAYDPRFGLAEKNRHETHLQ